MMTLFLQAKEGDDVEPDVLNVTDFWKVRIPLDSARIPLLDPQRVSGAAASFSARGEDCCSGPRPAVLAPHPHP